MNAQTQSVFDIMMNIPKMKNHGGILVTKDGEHIEVDNAIVNLANDTVYYNDDTKTIPLYSIKEARPLHLDFELPTRRDEAPIEDKEDEAPEVLFLSSREDYVSYDVELNSPSKLRRTYAEYNFGRKRKFEEISDDDGDDETEEEPIQPTPIIVPNDNDRPPFLEPSPRRIRKSPSCDVFNQLEDDHIKLAKIMIENNCNILKDALQSDYKVKIQTVNKGECVYRVIYIFTEDDETFAILSTNDGVLTHINVSEIMKVLPNINKFYEDEPIPLEDREYWKFLQANMNDEQVNVHRKTGIIISREDDNKWHFQGICDDEKYTMEEMDKIANWVKRCGFEVYPKSNLKASQPPPQQTEEIPSTPIKKQKEIQPPMAPRKQKREINLDVDSFCELTSFVSPMGQTEKHSSVARKLDFSEPKVEPTKVEEPEKKSYLDIVVQTIKELKQRGGCSRPLIKKYINDNFKNVLSIKHINNALCKGVEEGILIQNKQSFKINKELIKNNKQPSNKVSKDDELVVFLKNNINKKVKFNYREQPKIATIKSVDDVHLLGICERDNHIKKYNLIYIFDLELVPETHLNTKISLREELENNKHKNIQIVYKGENKDIMPYNLTDRIMVARCLKDGILKRYIIDNITNIKVKEEEEKTVKDILKESMDKNEAIFILYTNGSIPDIKRPIRVKGFQTTKTNKTMVIAECLVEDSIRRFNLDYIQIVA